MKSVLSKFFLIGIGVLSTWLLYSSLASAITIKEKGNYISSNVQNNFEETTKKPTNTECPPENANHYYYFGSQAAIGYYKKKYYQCTSLSNVVIDGSDITNLDAFDNLQKITGHPSIRKNNGIYQIYRGLFIGKNPMISTPDMNANPSLVTLSGFNNLKSVSGDIIISHNENLKSIDAFHNVSQLKGVIYYKSGKVYSETVGGNVVLESNPKLESVSVFGSISSLLGVEIIGNGNLKDIDMNLDGITSLHRFHIYNTMLKNMSIISSLEEIGSLGISNNDQLTSLEGLDNLKKFDPSFKDPKKVHLSNDKLLNQCSQLNDLYKIASNVFELKVNPECENSIKQG